MIPGFVLRLLLPVALNVLEKAFEKDKGKAGEVASNHYYKKALNKQLKENKNGR